jgi:hypothetical protein
VHVHAIHNPESIPHPLQHALELPLHSPLLLQHLACLLTPALSQPLSQPGTGLFVKGEGPLDLFVDPLDRVEHVPGEGCSRGIDGPPDQAGQQDHGH